MNVEGDITPDILIQNQVETTTFYTKYSNWFTTRDGLVCYLSTDSSNFIIHSISSSSHSWEWSQVVCESKQPSTVDIRVLGYDNVHDIIIGASKHRTYVFNVKEKILYQYEEEHGGYPPKLFQNDYVKMEYSAVLDCFFVTEMSSIFSLWKLTLTKMPRDPESIPWFGSDVEHYYLASWKLLHTSKVANSSNNSHVHSKSFLCSRDGTYLFGIGNVADSSFWTFNVVRMKFRDIKVVNIDKIIPRGEILSCIFVNNNHVVLLHKSGKLFSLKFRATSIRLKGQLEPVQFWKLPRGTLFPILDRHLSGHFGFYASQILDNRLQIFDLYYPYAAMGDAFQLSPDSLFHDVLFQFQ
jgi:hypothetical protein